MERTEGQADFDRLLTLKTSLTTQSSQAEKDDQRCSSSVGPQSQEETETQGQQQSSVNVQGNTTTVSADLTKGQSPGGDGVSLLGRTSTGSSVKPQQQLSNGPLAGFTVSDSSRSSPALVVRKKKRHVCNVCRRECPSKHKLRRHLSTHSEERPFSCRLCGKSFKWTEYLQKHLRQQHNGASAGGEGVPSPVNVTATVVDSSQSTTTTILASSSNTDTTITPTATTKQSPTPNTSVDSSPLPPSHITSPPPPPSTDVTNNSSSSSSSRSSSIASPDQEATLLSLPAKRRVVTIVPVTRCSNCCNRSTTLKQQFQSSWGSPQQQQGQQGQGLVVLSTPSYETASPNNNGTSNSVNNSMALLKTNNNSTAILSSSQVQSTAWSPQMQQQNVLPQQQLQQPQQQQVVQSISNGGISTLNVNQVSHTQQLQQTTQANLTPQKHNASIGVNMDGLDSSMLEGTCNVGMGLSGMGLGQTHMVSNTCSSNLHMGGGGGVVAAGQLNGVSQLIGSLQNDASTMVANQGFADSVPSNCLTQQQQQSMSQSLLVPQQQTFSTQLLQQPNIEATNSIHHSELQSIQQQLQNTDSLVQIQNPISNPTSISHSLSPIHTHPVPPPELIPDSHLSLPPAQAPQDPTTTSDMMQSLPQFIPDSLVSPLCGTVSGDSTMNVSDMVPQATALNYPIQQMGQPATQTSNVYSTVPSYMEMPQAQQHMVYDNTEQGMMSHVQNGMTIDQTNYNSVMQQNGLLTQPTQQNVGMMNHSMYAGQGGGHTLLMDQSQLQQQQQQHMMHNGYVPQLQDHLLQQPQGDSQMTQLGDHMNQQSHDHHMIQFTQGSSNVTTLQTPISTTLTSDFNGLTTTALIRTEDMDVETSNSLEDSVRRSIGIQCELGPETIRALQEEEEEETALEHEELTQMNENGVCYLQQQSSAADGTEVMEGEISSFTERLVQKYPCESENCAKAYIHRKDLIRHMKNQHGISPKKLETVVMETREKPFICPVGSCGRSYFHLKDLRRHQRLCHNVGGSGTSESGASENGDDKTQLRYPCDFPGCLRSYVHKKDLVRHKRLYHKDPSSKPNIPIPVRYTEMQLKRIRQEVKQEIDKTVEKIRLDSTGSTITSSGDEPPNSATSLEPDVDLATAGVLSPSDTAVIDQPSAAALSLNIVDSMQLALLIGAQSSSSSNGSQLGPNQVQLSDIIAAANSSTPPSIKPDTSLAQIISNAVQSGMVLATPPPLHSVESQEDNKVQSIKTKVRDEAATIILDETPELSVPLPSDEKQQRPGGECQPDNLLANLSAVVFPSNRDAVFNVGSLLNGSVTPSSNVSGPVTSIPGSSLTATVLEGEPETKVVPQNSNNDIHYDPTAVLMSKSRIDSLHSGAADSLHKFLVSNKAGLESSEVTQSSF